MSRLKNINLISEVAFLLVRYRLVALLVAFFIIFLCLFGLRHLSVENDYRSFIGENNEALKVSDWLSDRQGNERESVVLIYSAADKNVFSEQSLMQYTFLAREAKRLPYVAKVHSLLDMKKLVVLEKNLSNNKNSDYREAPFLFGVNIFTEEGRKILKHDALSLPTINSRYIGNDAASAAVIIFFEFDDRSSRRDQLTDFYSAVDAMQVSLKQENPEDNIKLAGASLFDYAASKVLSDDLRRILPLALLLIVVTFYVIYRSILFIPTALFIIFIPVLATAGLAATVGLEFSNLSISGLLLVGTLAVADVMHISNSYFKQMGLGKQREESLILALKSNIKVVVATTLTTSIGQIALLFSMAKPIQVMGWVIILGSWLALILTLFILPTVLMFIIPRNTTLLIRLSGVLEKISLIGFRFPKLIVFVTSCIVLVFIFVISQAKLMDSLTGWFAKDTAFHQGMELMNTHYLGGNTISFAVETLTEDLLAAKNLPIASESIILYQNIKQQINQVSGDGKWFDPVDTGNATNTILKEGEKSSVLIKDEKYFKMLKKFSTETVAHSGLMTRYQPGKSDYSLWFFDSSGRSSFELEQLAETISKTFKQSVRGRDVRTGGTGLALAQLSTSNFVSVLKGSLFSLLLISIVLFVVLGSWKLGFISIIPNITPLVIAFGVWAFNFGYFNLASITVFSISLGLIVDDTIHILLKYKQNLKNKGNKQLAFATAVNECGVGVLATTIVIGIGFLLLGTSGFLLTSQKTLLAALAIFIAFIFDILVLPAIVALSMPRLPFQRKKSIVR